MKSKNAKIPMVPLGDYIEEYDKKNTDNKIKAVRSVSVYKDFRLTNAKVNKEELRTYKIVPPGYIAYVQTTKNEKCFANAWNDTGESYVVSAVDKVIKSKNENALNTGFLHILFRSKEFDRYAIFNSWGSAREVFSYSDLCNVQIPLPDIDVQRSVVAAYKSLKNIIETNEALIEPLQSACNAYIVDLKAKYPKKELGPYIEECDERNTDGGVKLAQGISNEKYFQEPKQVAENSKSDRIVRTGQFAYNRATTRNGEKISIAFREGPDCTVSSAYGVFKVVDENVLMSQYLLLFFKRSEFDRYARYMSKGSAHEFFEMDEMRRVQIPLPPIEVQKAIVAVYKGLAEAKRIAGEAKEELKKLCPALMQLGAHSTK